MNPAEPPPANGALPVGYKGIELQPGYRLDLMIVGNQRLVELKAVERLLPVHEAQVITYLKLSGLAAGAIDQLPCRSYQARSPPSHEEKSSPRLPVDPSPRDVLAPKPTKPAASRENL